MIESKDREQISGKKYQDCLCLSDQEQVTALCRFYPKLARKHRSSSETQLAMPGDLSSDGFADNSVLCDKDTALQLSRCFPAAEPRGGVILVQLSNRELSN